MRVVRIVRSVVVASACVGILLPTQTMAAGAAHASKSLPSMVTVVGDISLGEAGQLSGSVLDAAGQPVAAAEVLLVERATGEHYRTVSDDQGRFAVRGLKGGLYQVTMANGSSLCRCWARGTAPPTAKSELLVVNGEQVQRGQRPLAEALFSTPTLLVLMIAAAIAIPIAVHNTKDDAS